MIRWPSADCSTAAPPSRSTTAAGCRAAQTCSGRSTAARAICNSPPPAARPKSGRWTSVAAGPRSPRLRSCPCQSNIGGRRRKARAPTSRKRTRVSPATIARERISAPPSKTRSRAIACSTRSRPPRQPVSVKRSVDPRRGALYLVGRPPPDSDGGRLDDLRSGVGLDDSERGALRIAENADAAHLGHVHWRDERGAAELLCFRGRRVGVLDRDVRLPVRRQRVVGKRHQSGYADLAAVEDPVAAVLGTHVTCCPAEDLAVEALRVVSVGRSKLVPDEHALGAGLFALRLLRADVGPLRVGNDRDASDLAHLERAGRQLAACAFRLLDRLVQVLDPDVTQPVRRWSSLHCLAEAAVVLSA